MDRTRHIILVIIISLIFTAQSVNAMPLATSTVATSSQLSTTTSTPNNSSDLQVILQELVDKIVYLEDEVASLEKKLAISQAEKIFSRDLQFGSYGQDVMKLQEVLRAIPGVYPEGLVTGYYGPKTKKAVENFQKREGVGVTGEFDEDTKAVLIELATPQANTDGLVQADNSLEDQIANLNLRDVAPPPEISSSSDTETASTTTPEDLSIPIDAALLGTSQPAADASAAPPPAAPAPAPAPIVLSIYNVSAQNITASAAQITWTTNVSADSRVEFGPTQKYKDGVTDLKLVTSHSVSLANLEKNTTYHYLAKSFDANGNAATSSDQTFTTLAK